MWKVEKFSVERKEMSEKIPVEFVTDWKKVARYWLRASRKRRGMLCKKSFLK